MISYQFLYCKPLKTNSCSLPAQGLQKSPTSSDKLVTAISFTQFTVQIQMNHQPPHNNHLETRIKQLQKDKLELSQAIDSLNQCYQEKISLLQDTISQQQNRIQDLLEWKNGYIDRNLFEVERYEIEIKKMIDILDNAHLAFQGEREGLKKELDQEKQQVRVLTDENTALKQFSQQYQLRIDQLQQHYSEDIERLTHQLRLLKEESTLSQDSLQMPLRELTTHNNLENMAPNETLVNFPTQEESAFGKYSLQTVI